MIHCRRTFLMDYREVHMNIIVDPYETTSVLYDGIRLCPFPFVIHKGSIDGRAYACYRRRFFYELVHRCMFRGYTLDEVAATTSSSEQGISRAFVTILQGFFERYGFSECRRPARRGRTSHRHVPKHVIAEGM